MAVIGIDLGTTNSCVATIEGGRATVIANAEGSRTTPSIVAFGKDGERMVGTVAARQQAMNPDRTVASVKRHMGTDWSINVDGKSFSAQEISAMILSKLKADAQAYLGQDVRDAVITVPAYFDDVARQATKDAGRIAGLNVLRIINEPTSAALAYGLDNGHAQKVTVYDLGGGTFDVSVIGIGDDVIEVLATCGDNHLGGDDFDQRLTDHLVEQFKQQHPGAKLDAQAMQRVREAAVQAKKELSATASTTVNLPFLAQDAGQPVHLETEVTRAQFERMTADLVERTSGPVNQALRDAGVTAAELDQVLLVGGSTRIPAVQEHVRRLTGKQPSSSINPDECVACGAAIQASTLANALAGGSAAGDSAPGSEILLLDVTPLTLSIETVGDNAVPLVHRNTTLPAHYSQIFTTTSPMQTQVEINVLQGERPRASDNKSIGKFRLKGIKRMSNPQIEVTFDIDANGILRVSAKDLGTGKEQSITIDNDQRMSEEEIEAAIRDAQQYAAQDDERREASRVRNEAQSLLNTAQTALEAHKKDIEKDEKRTVQRDIAALQKALTARAKKGAENDVAAIKEAADALEQSSAHIRSL